MKQCWNRIPCAKIHLVISSVMLCNGLPCIALDLQRDAHLIYGFLLLILRVKIIDEINS